MGKIKNIISFFSGVGGIELGFMNSGKFDVVYANEFDKHARRTYEANFNLKVDDKDIRDVNIDDIPNADILLAGFPCQPFSVAGYRKGFEDERGDLFFETLKIIIEKEPKVIFLENVKNMVTHDNGNTFKVIRESLELNGYYLKWAVLNAKDFGNIPQNRERIYIVGFRSKMAFEKFQFPKEVKLTNTIKSYIDFENIVDDRYYYNEKKNPTLYRELISSINSQDTVYQWRRQYVRENKSGVVPTLTANMGTGGHNVPLILSDFGIRKLTPRETFNIQGYPKDFILPNDISDGQLYKQAGNSVAIPVIQRIAESINIALEKSSDDYNEFEEGRYALTYTKMNGNESGESYHVRSFRSKELLYDFLQFRKYQIITNKEYSLLVKKKQQLEFFMVNDTNNPIIAYA